MHATEVEFSAIRSWCYMFYDHHELAIAMLHHYDDF